MLLCLEIKICNLNRNEKLSPTGLNRNIYIWELVALQGFDWQVLIDDMENILSIRLALSTTL